MANPPGLTTAPRPTPPDAADNPRGSAGAPLRALALLAVIALAVVLRAWGLQAQLPYLYHPDELRNVEVAEAMLRERDPNPHFFNYPSALFYAQAGAFLALGAVAEMPWETGQMHLQLSQGNGLTSTPAVFVAGRLIALAATAAMAGLAFAAAQIVTGRWQVGALAGVLVAICPLAVREGRLVTPDALAGALALAAVTAAVVLVRRASAARFAVAGSLVGLAASAKYNAALVAVPVVVAHLVRPRPRSPGVLPLRYLRRVLDWRLVLAGLAAVVAFLAVTPFAALDFPAFTDGVRDELRHYSRGHAGSQGSPLSFYLRTLWAFVGPLLGFAPLAFIRGRRRWRELVVLAVAVIAYLLFISRYPARFERNLMPLLGPLLVLVAVGMSAVTQALRARVGRRPGAVVAAVVCVGLLAIPLYQTVQLDVAATRDERAEPREWIAANVPAGARIVVESYGPWVDPARFAAQGTLFLARKTPEEYRADGVQYVVAAEAYYGRFFADPARYRRQVAIYERFFDEFDEVARFGGPGTTIRVLRVAPRPG